MNARFTLVGPKDAERAEKNDLTLGELLGAIEALDGQGHTGLLLRPTEPTQPYLGIAGGHEGLYVVFIAIDGEFAKHVVNPNIPKGTDDLRIRCGGQMSDMDLHFLVSKEQAIKAAECYFAHCSACSDLVWEETWVTLAVLIRSGGFSVQLESRRDASVWTPERLRHGHDDHRAIARIPRHPLFR